MSSKYSAEEIEIIRRQEYYFAYMKRELRLMEDRMKDLIRFTRHDETSSETSQWDSEEIEVRAKIEDRCGRIREDLEFCFWKSEISYCLARGRRVKAKADPPPNLPNVLYYDKTEMPSTLVLYDEEEEEKKGDSDDDDKPVSPMKRSREVSDDTTATKST